MLDPIDVVIPFYFMILCLLMTMLANSTHVMPPIGGIDEIPQRGQVYDYVYVRACTG